MNFFKPVITSLFFGLLALPASASYIAVTWDDDGSVSDYEWSDADGYTFTIEEYSDDLRVEADLGGRKLRIDALVGLLDDNEPGADIGSGVYDIDILDADDPNLIDHTTFQSEGTGDFFEIISIGGWNDSGDTFDSLVFNFQISENDDLLTGTGCIGVSCGSTAVPVPAAVWLFGSAIAGLGWMRRKRTV